MPKGLAGTKPIIDLNALGEALDPVTRWRAELAEWSERPDIYGGEARLRCAHDWYSKRGNDVQIRAIEKVLAEVNEEIIELEAQAQMAEFDAEFAQFEKEEREVPAEVERVSYWKQEDAR